MKSKQALMILMLSCCSFAVLGMDSLRMETSNGKKFIVHRVETKETLFAISKKYNVKIDELLIHNKGIENGLKINQEILVPYFGEEPEEKLKARNGTVFHVVKSGDTFYSISKKYDVTVDSIMAMNKLKTTTLNLGDELIVGYRNEPEANESTILTDVKPLLGDVISSTEPSSERPTSTDQFHIVKASETLYAISRLYNVEFNKIKELNNLNSNELDIGQKLLISKVKKVEFVENTEQRQKPLPEEAIQKKIVKKDTITNIQLPKPIKIDTLYVKTDNSRFKERIEKMGNLDKTVEEGFAMKIQNTEDSRKYLALHRNAPIGTVIEVKNQMNNQSIFARVVGKLPETGLNKNVLLRVSNAAFEQLKALDASIPVEIGYVMDNE
jgi:LysM repeat protein